ncbi:MAG: DUF4328 domain-containing protein [Acidimicrobiia bacterium]
MTAWRPNTRLVGLLTLLLPAAAVVAMVRAVAFAQRLVALGSSDGADFRARARDADEFVASTDLALGLTVLVVAPVFVTWMWRAAKNQQALGRAPERLGPGWAIGGWFIPLANLVIPVLIVQDLWRGSSVSIARGDPRWRIADRSWLVGGWWGLFLGALLAISGEPADSPGLRLAFLEQRNALALIGSLACATAAVLGLLVVRELSRRQEECRRVQEVAAPATAAGVPAS